MALFSKSNRRKTEVLVADRVKPPTDLNGARAAGAAGYVSEGVDEGVAVPPADPAMERRVMEIGSAFLDAAHKNRAGLLSAAFWSDKLMDWAMNDRNFKVQLFRFVDTFPMLKTSEQVHDHLIDYLTQHFVDIAEIFFQFQVAGVGVAPSIIAVPMPVRFRKLESCVGIVMVSTSNE